MHGTAQTTADTASATATSALTKATANETEITALKADTGWQEITLANYTLYYRKIGHEVTIDCISKASVTLAGSSQTAITVLANELKPTQAIRFNPYVRGNSNVYGQIQTNGTLILFNWGAQATLDAGQIGFTVTYPI